MAMLLSAVSDSLAMMQPKLKRLSWCILLILKSTVNMDFLLSALRFLRRFYQEAI